MKINEVIMKKEKTHQELSLMEAVDNLSSLAELDTEKAPQELSEEEISIQGIRGSRAEWKDLSHKEENKERVRETFRVLHNYLRHVYEKEGEQLEDLETQKGLRAIMVLAGEAAQKVDRFTSLFKSAHESESVTHLDEYKQLQHFYQTKVMRKFQESLESEEAWIAEWGKEEEGALDIQRRGLKDLETVRRDKEYEFFMIRKEDGRPFYNQNLLRHIKLVGDFDETVSGPEGEDPFQRIKGVQDREAHVSAKEMLRLASPHINEFYKEALRHKEMPLVSSLNKALMALLLTSNPRNLLQNTTGKSCRNYFADFHYFLREALSSEAYKRFTSSPPKESDYFLHTTLHLVHALCAFFFMHIGSRKEAIELIYRLIEKSGKNAVSAFGEKIPLWNTLLDEDEQIRAFLKRYPSGPLLKTLDVLRQGPENRFFDPLSQGNFPTQIFTLSYDDVHVSCFRSPSPTRQEFIQKGVVAEEFSGFLRFLNVQRAGERHLLINMQDRTAWQEHTRCILLEELQKDAEFVKSLIVVTLPKNSDFYLQAAGYEELHHSKDFIEQFKEQIASGEQCGFYFPAPIKTKEFAAFIPEAMELVHNLFFSKKNVLSRKERLDFIEIFYQFLIMKLIDMTHPDSLSLICKDGVDISAAANAALFCFARMLSQSSPWSQEEKDFLLWMLYAPALLVREREIDPTRLHRVISALSLIDAEIARDRGALLEAVHKLYRHPLFSHLEIH